MFIKLRDFKRMIKEAYKGMGLYISRRENQLLFSNSIWILVIAKETMDKKELAAVIELTGELPEDGQAFKSTEAGNQYEIKDIYWNLIDDMETSEEKEEKITITSVVLQKHPYGRALRVLQRKDGHVEVMDDSLEKAISAEEMNKECEFNLEGPFVNMDFPRQIYWRSETTTLFTPLYRQDEMPEKDFLEYLQNTEILR